MRLGVLALQGDFAAHRGRFEPHVDSVGGAIDDVRRVHQLDPLDALVMPGGESTALLKLMQHEPWFDALRAFVERGGAIFGTCAGAILLASEVLDPRQASLGLVDATVRRNGYGRQIDSFEAEIPSRISADPLRAVFIRAPRFERVGPGVEVLAEHAGEPVLIRQGRVAAATFHPELTDDDRLQRWFLDEVALPPANRSERRPEARAAVR